MKFKSVMFSFLLSTAVAMGRSHHQCRRKPRTLPPRSGSRRSSGWRPAQATVRPPAPHAVLLFSLTTGFQHSVRPYATEIIKVLATKTKAFTVVESMDIECFSPENLAKFDAVILNNCCPDAKHRDLFLDVLTNTVDKSIKDIGLKYKDLTDGQRRQMAAELEKNLIDFVAGGKGLVSIHGSIAFQNNSAAFGEMMGASFDFHPKRQMLTLNLVDPAHPLVAAFKGEGFIHSDELYMFKNAYSKLNFRPLLEADMGKLDDASRNNPKITGKKHLYVSWIKRHGKGRVFYVSPSHQPQSYENECILKFHLDGIQYALGDLPCDDSPLK